MPEPARSFFLKYCSETESACLFQTAGRRCKEETLYGLQTEIRGGTARYVKCKHQDRNAKEQKAAQ